MAKRMLIDALHPEETRVAIADNSHIYEFDFVTATKKQLKGNIYLAKITRVEPSLQAAFVEYGGGKQGFLPFSEIHHDYYQIPLSDRKRLIEEVEREQALLDEEDDEAIQSATQLAEEGEETAPDTSDAPEDSASLEEPSAEHESPMAFEVPLAQGPLSEQTEDEEAATAKTMAEQSAQAAAETMEVTENTQSIGGAPSAPADTEGKESAAKAENGNEGVETIVNEEEEMSSSRQKRTPFFKRYRIQEVIKRGQVVLVQVIKEERGNKGVSLTTYLSLAGRYCVLMPNSPRDGGVSRKISDNETRKRLKSLMSEMKTARGMSVIIRTAGIDRTRTEIRRDFDYLVKLWNRIREDTLAATAPELVHEESNLIKRAIRDQYTSDIEEVLVEGEGAYKTSREFMKMLLPSHTPRVKLYNESVPLFYAYGIEEQLLSMHDPIVKLKSGGYIVINPTEALISIDVNSGRSTGERNIEETAAKTNLEAASEIARQLRLRDLAGLIVIDFIDMMESRNRRNVERAIKDALKADRAKIQLGRISPFGLLEMSRQRLRPSISEASTVQCPHCVGRGVIRSNESMTIQLIRALEKDAATGQWQGLRVRASAEVALHLLNHKRNLLAAIEDRYAVQIIIEIDSNITASNYTVDRTRKDRGARTQQQEGGNKWREPRRNNRPEAAELLAEESAEAEPDDVSSEETAETESSNADNRKENPRRRRRGRRGGRERNSDGTAEGVESGATDAPEITDAEPQDAAAEEGKSSRPARGTRGRGRNTRKRWKDNTPEGAETAESQESAEAAPRPSRGRPKAEPAYVRESESTAERQPAVVVATYPKAESTAELPVPPPPTHRPDGAPARKGWWQKMIELE